MLREVTSNQEKYSHRKVTTALLYPSIRETGEKEAETGCLGLTMQVNDGELREGSRINVYYVQNQ